MEQKIKHLEFIQGVINRMSNNSFILKGWSVTLISALFALSANNANGFFVFLAYIPAICFWGLDGYFLSQERKFRELYNKVASLKPENIDFLMNTSEFNSIQKTGWLSSTFSRTLFVFHGALIGAIIIVMIFLTKN